MRDRAGNVGSNPVRVPFDAGDSPGPAGITVRSLAAQPPLRPVTAGREGRLLRRLARAPVPLGDPPGRRQAAGPRAGKVAAGAKGPLKLRAPRGKSGLYLVELQSGRNRTEVPFLVQARERATMLVVVPAITWLGTDPVDDPPLRDGMPDTLDRAGGGRVRWPRVFAGEDGRPAGLSSQVAPLLRYLDRNRIRYDLTSDLDLALSDSPRASDRKAVLLAGSMRWVPRTLARRLRRYVQDGGHLATFGPETLRRGVTLRADDAETAGELLRPTQPSAEDPFGARLEPCGARTPRSRSPSSAATRPTGCSSARAGRSTASARSRSPRRRTRAARRSCSARMGVAPPEPDPDAPADEPPPEARYALTASRIGEKGLVIRVGLPQWAQRLREPQVAQVTRNIVDLLRGQEPKIRTPPLAARARSRAGRSRRRAAPSAPTAAGCARARARRARRRSARRRAPAAASCRSPAPSAPPYQSSASGCSASSARASGYWAASKTTIARGWPGSAIRRAWPAAIRSRSSAGSRDVAP